MDSYEARELRRAMDQFPAEDFASAMDALGTHLIEFPTEEIIAVMRDLTDAIQRIGAGTSPTDPYVWRCVRCGGGMSSFPRDGWYHKCSGERVEIGMRKSWNIKVSETVTHTASGATEAEARSNLEETMEWVIRTYTRQLANMANWEAEEIQP